MQITRTISIIVAFASLMLASALCKANATGLQATFNSNGLQTMTYKGVQLTNTLTNGSDAFSVYEYERLSSTGTITDVYSWNGGYASSWNALTKTLTWTYDWGTVSCQYALTSSRLTMTLTITNTTPGDTINGVDILPLVVQFPTMPAGYSQNLPQVGFTSDGPNVQFADYSTAVLALCNQDVTNNRYFGFFPLNNGTSPYTAFTVWASTLPLSFQTQSWPTFNHPVGPGQTDSYTISLRFAAEGTLPTAMAGDVYKGFASAWPYQVNWNDHRMIGAMFLATSQTHPPTNPRGWFGNDPTVDVTTPQGVAAFQQRVLQYAQTSIPILQQMNAQGIIQWDVEGQQYPQPTSYIGDPTLLPTLAPEMDSIADQYFQTFTNAGLKVGLCIRPQQLVFSPSVEQTDVSDPAQLLITKINYARQRWGCTLFYVDSNVDEATGGTMDASVFQTVANAEPGVLILPEHSNTKYYAYTSPFEALTNDGTGTPATTAYTYPKSFSGVYTADGDITGDFNTLVSSVSRGDLLLFRGWWNDPENAQDLSIYQTAGAGLPVITSAAKASGKVNASFTYQVVATNGPASFTATGLPPGLALNTSTGAITGKPTSSGTYAVLITGSNWGGTGPASIVTMTIAAAKKG